MTTLSVNPEDRPLQWNRLFTFFRCAVTLMISLTASSCSCIPSPLTTPNKAYHTGPAAVKKLEAGAWLGHVEFDDQGELWSHNQLRIVTEKIRSVAARGRVKLILYAHGWNNTAREDAPLGKNFEQFENLLNALAEIHSEGQDNYPYQIFGVFLSWRGHEFPRRAGIDIWDRLQAASRVGGLSGTEAVVDLALAARTNPQSLVLLTGHSLGTIIAENTANRVLMSHVLEAKYRRGGGHTGPLFDIVLLVNSAQSSLIPHQMIAGLKAQGARYRNHGHQDVPLIFLLTAQDDWLTGKLFPLSVLFARANPLNTQVSGKVRGRYADGPDGDTHDPASQRTTQFMAGAHNASLRSHTMVALDRKTSGSSAPPDRNSMKNAILENLDSGKRFAGDSIEIHGDSSNFLLQRSMGAWNNTPYWVCSTPKEFFSGHSGFWDNNNTVALTAALLGINGERARLSSEL